MREAPPGGEFPPGGAVLAGKGRRLIRKRGLAALRQAAGAAESSAGQPLPEHLESADLIQSPRGNLQAEEDKNHAAHHLPVSAKGRGDASSVAGQDKCRMEQDPQANYNYKDTQHQYCADRCSKGNQKVICI